jgi:uncharacterized peroxidase-related enzyme
MPHIALPPSLPGILSLFAYRPETAGPLNALAETLLRGPSALTRGERELIAAFVSKQNECVFCNASHAAFARAQLPNGADVVRAVCEDYRNAPIGEKLRALLAIAAQVQKSGRAVTVETVEAARAEGASDQEIHDTVLIAAAFCMFNRYVDGLGTVLPPDPAAYDVMAERIVSEGYTAPKG